MILQVIGAYIASFAFSIYLEVPKKYALYAGSVGAFGWSIFLLAQKIGFSVTAAAFLCSFNIAFVSHLFARFFKAPVTIFLIAGILPIVPGEGMYRIVYNIITGDRIMSSYYFYQTLQIAGMIAVAIFLTDSLFRITKRKKKSEDKLKN